MNKNECDLILLLDENDNVSQRQIAEMLDISLGNVNKCVKNLKKNHYLNENMKLTSKAKKIIELSRPKSAIILAAGFGMRMVPINLETPKALLDVKGEILIERIINQLHEAGVTQIYVVVGFMKEKFEYLIDDYGVELIYNGQYSVKNNFYSMYLASNKMSNTYIVPCDIWCKNNPFSRNELYSWYMVGNSLNCESDVRVNRKKELVSVGKTDVGNEMIGISYLVDKDCNVIREKLERMTVDNKNDDSFWEESLYDTDKMIPFAKEVDSADVVEINTYEQLRELDGKSNDLKSKAIDIIASALKVQQDDIKDITVLKKGMTNRSFLFSCNNKKYIMRIPGEGTDLLINRKNEASVYKAICDKKICDDIVYINEENGYKITEFLENARVCDSENDDDLYQCMKKLKFFHKQNIKVDHDFDIFGQIDFYESLWEGNLSVFRDYKETKDKVLSLKGYIDKNVEDKCLTHIDAVPDNFLFVEKDGKLDLRLIDWEYAGMQDPHVDIAMFCIYALYDRKQVDHLIDIYFEGNCDDNIRIKIYCYIAVCGLLWSNWCEYKRILGVEFGDYFLKQYRYAKDYYKIVKEELSKKGETL